VRRPLAPAGVARRVLGVALAGGVALAAVACNAPPGGRAPGQGAGVPVTTPMPSLSAPVEVTAALLREVVGRHGYRLDVSPAPYRPSEPASLVPVPRAVLRANTPDTGHGFVVIYELPDSPSAARHAQDMASHVGSGFGQTNFPSDAQFHVAHLDRTVIFTWWSRAAVSDEAAAETVFEALRTVGLAVPVLK
jgi:hypothetical protein